MDQPEDLNVSSDEDDVVQPEAPAEDESVEETPVVEQTPDVEDAAAEDETAEGEATEDEVAEAVAEPVAEYVAVEETVVEEPEAEAETAQDEAAPEEAAQDEAADVDAALVEAVEEALEGVEAEEEAEPLPEWIPGDWYVVHTYAGYENKVKVDLETRVASMNMEEAIYEVVIPMEEVMEVKGGKKQMVQRKVFPGYLLVRMDLNDDSWYVVRNTPGVTGFVGSGTKPIPLSEREVDKILQRKGEAEKPKPKQEWNANDPVRVTTGPFANFQGLIAEVDDERQKVKVLVNIFGRETPVELSYDQISKV